jgi:farnesyl-diphosphate farnesyltransferase
MGNKQQSNTATEDELYQSRILQGVSRTFALTIPVLPRPLSRVVSNAYLLCRIADTIEDDKYLPVDKKSEFSKCFINVVAGQEPAADFSTRLYPLLSQETPVDERDLILHTSSVIRISHSFNKRQQAALQRCVSIMSDGMTRYQETDVRHGLADQVDMDQYCYYVAGVVGEMLTELFCDYSPAIDKNRETLMQLSVSFGQGLQMTNILKDIWDDQDREMCWLPREIFREYGADLDRLAPDVNDRGFQQALGHMVGIARSHLEHALRYTLLIPAEETGIRRFCLWALGMAVLTLRRINANRSYTSGHDVKISRRSVKATILFCNLFTRSDTMLQYLFKLTARSLPTVQLSENFSQPDSSV